MRADVRRRLWQHAREIAQAHRGGERDVSCRVSSRAPLMSTVLGRKDARRSSPRIRLGCLLLSVASTCAHADKQLTHMARQFSATYTAIGTDRRITRYLREHCSRDRDVYQFGVFTGGGLKKIAASAGNCRQVFGFDSFEGIPSETHEEFESWHTGKKYKQHFGEGGYSAAAAFNDTSLRSVLRRVAQFVGHPERVTLIGGYFNETCNARTLRKHRMQPALYVDMDADIYLSAIQALDWMFGSGLIIPGTIVRYDDWPRKNATRGPRKGTNFYGQARAHYELSERWDVKWRLIAKTSVQAITVGQRRCVPPACKLAPSLRELFGDGANSANNRYDPQLLPLWSPQHNRAGLFD